MSFGELLKEARKKMNMSQDDLASKLGVNRVSISNYEQNKNTPTLANLKKLREVLGLSPDYFEDNKRKTVREVNIVGTASCGGADINYLQENDRVCYYNGEHYKKNLYCVIANGDSMATDIEDGDEVICDPDAVPQNGDIVHYTIGDESAIKVYVEDKEAFIIQFVPFNASEDFRTKTIRLDDDEAQQIKISKVIAINKLKLNNRAKRLKLIGRI